MHLVKGTTRRIVEIKQPDSSYFEKVVFYCRANMPKSADNTTLTQEAGKIIDRLCVETQIKLPMRHNRLLGVLKTFAYVVAGAVGALIVFRLRF